ncbi:hypothetical protein T552_02059 [Pneumocystis carinii B80]|uniref:Exportin-T n=1 Tax=Pneumocystis carinii (strain B80) TaxID=1408658 RepID=A0A0W4ZGW0_PNEC8|nr:hypothetical protein T552_02059 [Pneumocystis carinii B80]KTW27617.1 hypothetical protein T552_02059 [Pneumocystis carinii B80]
MEESIDQAIKIVFQPDADISLKQQAIEFCDQVKNCPEGWQICLTLFTKIPKKSEEIRLFSLQVLEYAIKSRINELTPESLDFIKNQMLEWIRQEFSLIGLKTIDPPFLRNKLSHFFSLVFITLYTTSWSSFFADILSLIQDSSQTGKTCPEATEFYLKILLSIHEEIADQQIPRKPDELHRNNSLKNKIRQNDIHHLTDSWYRLMIEYQQINKNIVELCMKVVGKYISWIDISLIVNNSYMTFVFGLLGDKQLRNIACETLVEIISKKMKYLDKLELIFLLNIVDHINKLNLNEDTDFTENLARLINCQIIELICIFGDNSLSKEAYLKADALLFNTIPFLLRFLSDEYDNTSSAVFPALTELLTLFRKQKKVGEIESSRKNILEPILNTLIMKTKYDQSLDWLNDRKTYEYAEFLEMRKKLHTFQDMISSIDYNLYCNCILHLVTNGLEKAFSEADWRHLELILYEVFSFGEGLKVFTYINNNDNDSPTVLGQLLGMIINSEVSSYPHPSVQLHYLEIAVRYASFFEYQPSLIPKVLETMLDHRGLRHHDTHIKKRAPYLFLKYLRLLSNRIDNFSETTLEAIRDLLTIKLEPMPETNINNGIDTDITPIKGLFESTFYLFEAAGLLISTKTISKEKKISLAYSILEPLFSDFQKYLSSDRDNDVNVLYIYHIIMAIGNFSKGFPDISREFPSIDSISKTFLQACELILVALEALKHKEIIREAARFSFARLTNILDLEVLPKFPRLINGLLSESKTSELVDFLPFLGLLIHKFKSNIYDILNSLFMPLLNKIFQSLNEFTEGTDDIIIQNDLKKKYLEFVLALMNNDLDTVCVSDINQPNFETFLRSIIHFAADISDPSTEKIAFSILNKMVDAWAFDQSHISDIKTRKVVPGFDQFIFHSLSSLCFEVPSKQSFNPRDTQAIIVLSEMSNLQFTIFKKKEAEFERYLYNIYFPSVNIPQEIAKEYIEALKQLNAKQFKTFFQNFINKLR